MKASKSHPYPVDFEEFLDWFPTEQDCLDYLEWVRWGDGFVCPKCGHDQCWTFGDGRRKLRKCGKCHRQISITTDTVFDSGKKSLRLWFHVAWLLMAQRTGISAKNFQDMFGFGSYQTTWGWLQKLRSVMVRRGREKLTGRVEVDETYIGGQAEGRRGRGAGSKTLVAVAVEGDASKMLGRVRFQVIKTHSAEALKTFVTDFVDEGATIVTDGLKSYGFIDELKYNHETHVLAGNPSSGDSNLERVHLVISLLKRWMLGTLQGAVTPGHLTEYLNEFAFRFNRRMSTHRGKLFYRLIQQSITKRPKNIKDLYNHDV